MMQRHIKYTTNKTATNVLYYTYFSSGSYACWEKLPLIRWEQFKFLYVISVRLFSVLLCIFLCFMKCFSFSHFFRLLLFMSTYNLVSAHSCDWKWRELVWIREWKEAAYSRYSNEGVKMVILSLHKLLISIVLYIHVGLLCTVWEWINILVFGEGGFVAGDLCKLLGECLNPCRLHTASWSGHTIQLHFSAARTHTKVWVTMMIICWRTQYFVQIDMD